MVKKEKPLSWYSPREDFDVRVKIRGAEVHSLKSSKIKGLKEIHIPNVTLKQKKIIDKKLKPLKSSRIRNYRIKLRKVYDYWAIIKKKVKK